MWAALENVTMLVRPGGTLFIALYNDQGRKSRFWKRVKQVYCSGPAGKALINGAFIPWFTGRHVLRSVVQRKNLFAEYKKNRGMSVMHDWADWLGGLPFEVAGVEPIFHFYQDRGFDLQNIITANGGLGNNEFVFVKRYGPTLQSPKFAPAPPP
jgi:2-polyprenyl-6-hydroxyphenyl methylase/3-demethylubiquinone-9 3-methyltransferase